MGFYWSHDLHAWFRGIFGITLETDDIIDFSSYKKGKEILEKYKIKF